MSNSSSATPTRYIAQLRHVREVGLLGTADLQFWKDRLRAQHLCPIDHAGQARILITALESKWMGIPFRDLSVAVFVCLPHEPGQCDGVYLAQAWNASRFFAFVEQRFFQLPYAYAQDVHVDVGLPAAFQMGCGADTRVRAEMSGKRPATDSADSGWEVPIFLPGDGTDHEGGPWLGVKVTGDTRVYPFQSPDTLELQSTKSDVIIQQLQDSNFAGESWSIREDATHARTKTFKRSALMRLQSCND